MIQQLTFDLPGVARLTRAEFFVSPSNALALAAIDDWQNWPNRKMLLIGPQGAGKTHLSQIWAAATGAAVIAALDLADCNLPDLAAQGAVAVEDAETLADNIAAQTALFHLHNMLAASGALLVTAHTPPRDWGMSLPDLASRMQATALTRLDPPDDALLSAVLDKLFSDRQLAVAETVKPYLVARMERSIAAARALVDALDAYSLSQHRPISRALAAELLESHDPE